MRRSAGRAKSSKLTCELTGFPGSPNSGTPAQQPERERFRRLDRDLPPLQDTEPVEDSLDDVEVADGDAAAGDHRVAGGQRVFHCAFDVRLVVARDAEVHRVGTGGFEHREQHRPVRVTDLTRRERNRAFAQLVTGGQHTDPRRGITETDSSPRLAITPRCAGPSAVPGSKTRWPATTSPPASRMWSPLSAGWCTKTPSSPSRNVRSTMTIASAPSGIGAPVMIRIASPGPTGASARAPPRDPRPLAAAPAPRLSAPVVSAARTAYPSIAVFANGGTGSAATMGSASTRPSASASGTGFGASTDIDRRTSACTSSSGITGGPYARRPAAARPGPVASSARP